MSKTHCKKTPAESVTISIFETVWIDKSVSLFKFDRSDKKKKKFKKKSCRFKNIYTPDKNSIANKTPI